MAHSRQFRWTKSPSVIFGGILTSSFQHHNSSLAPLVNKSVSIPLLDSIDLITDVCFRTLERVANFVFNDGMSIKHAVSKVYIK